MKNFLELTSKKSDKDGDLLNNFLFIFEEFARALFFLIVLNI